MCVYCAQHLHLSFEFIKGEGEDSNAVAKTLGKQNKESTEPQEETQPYGIRCWVNCSFVPYIPIQYTHLHHNRKGLLHRCVYLYLVNPLAAAAVSICSGSSYGLVAGESHSSPIFPSIFWTGCGLCVRRTLSGVAAVRTHTAVCNMYVYRVLSNDVKEECNISYSGERETLLLLDLYAPFVFQ